MNRKFFIGSVGEPNKDYTEENRIRCISLNAHVMHKDTTQKGVFDRVEKGDICFLKYNKQLIAFGEVKEKEVSNDKTLDDWTYLVKVNKWFFYDEEKKTKGVNYYGISEHTMSGAGQMGTIKEIDFEYGLSKIKEIAGEKNEVYIKIIRELTMNTNLIRMQYLLENNKNLILTGAPGTGKTYLAKQIARQIVSKTEKEKPINVLKEAIEKYISDDEEEQKRKNLLANFLNIYPKEKLQDMSLEDYCIGNSDVNNNNFCYWMERKLEPLGRYFPGSSKSYMVYWNKTDEEYKVHGYLKTMSDKPEVVMKTLAKDISNMVIKDDPMSMAKKIGESFILKILSVYYPFEYAPINSRVHIDNIISLFGIQCESDKVFERNKAIYRFYEDQTQEKKISPWAFMSILYHNFNIKDGEVIQDGVIKKEGDFCIVQFHPSYDYSDFVEGLRPSQDENGNLGFERKDGVFKDLCVKALKNPNKNYVMIIDEINRGEISKIFGELFFSVDPGYRGMDGSVRTQYANMQTTPNEFDALLGFTESNNCGHFFVPENVYIIGTMNDIDRSVESMDFAFRRRFAFKEITAKDSQKMLDSDEAWGKDNNDVSRKPNEEELKIIKEKMDALNNLICPEKKNGGSEEGIDGLSSAYHIGASYFLKLVNYKKDDGTYDYDQLWDNHLEGLLLEYMRGMTDVSEKIKTLAIAFGYSKMEKYE